MRTTLTLDEDVAAALKRLRKTREASFKEVVNQVLRAGLQQIQSPRPAKQTFRTREAALGRPRVNNLDNVAEALAIAEGESFG